MSARDRAIENLEPAQRTKQLLASAGAAWVSLFISAVAACGGRDVPAVWPEKSAASPAAEAAPPALVTRALDGPPPLPGEPATGWAGLSPTSEPSAHGSAQAAVVYVCPMHPDVVADHPGTCPRCGMTLVKRDGPK